MRILLTAALLCASFASSGAAQSNTTAVLNDLLDLARTDNLDLGALEQTLTERVEGATLREAHGTEHWPVALEDPYGLTFKFALEMRHKGTGFAFDFNCTRFGPVTHAYFEEAGLAGEDAFGLTNLTFNWITDAGLNAMPAQWPANAAYQMSCTGTHIPQTDQSPFSNDDLVAFFTPYIPEDDPSRRTWPTMMVTDSVQMFLLRAPVLMGNHRIETLQVSNQTRSIAAIELTALRLIGPS